MNTPNEHGVYEKEISEDVARKGRAFAAVHLCQCQDGLYRYALTLMCSTFGFSAPITDHGTGYATAQLARQEALAILLGRLAVSRSYDTQSVRDEVAELHRQIARQLEQPSLF